MNGACLGTVPIRPELWDSLGGWSWEYRLQLLLLLAGDDYPLPRNGFYNSGFGFQTIVITKMKIGISRYRSNVFYSIAYKLQ